MSDTVRVYPSLTLGPAEYVRGVPAAGADMTREEAQPLLDAGLVTTTKPHAAGPPVLVSDSEGNPVPLGTYVVGDRGPELLIAPNRPAAPAAEPKE